MKRVSIALVLVMLAMTFAAHAQNVLLVDKWMKDPLAFKPFYDNFEAEGVEFNYRRYHPTLVQADVENYDIIMVGGGTHPSPSATHMRPEEGELLKKFVEDGGTVVILYQSGTTDNYVFNKMLWDMGLKLQIEGKRLMDPTGYKSTLIPATYFLNLPMLHVDEETPLAEDIEDLPLPGGRVNNIMVGQAENLEIAAWTGPLTMRLVEHSSNFPRQIEMLYAAETRKYAAVTAANFGEGHIVLASRGLFNMNGYTGRWSDKPLLPPYDLEGNHQFDHNFVRYVKAIANGEHEPGDRVNIRRVVRMNAPEKPEDLKFASAPLPEEAPKEGYVDLIDFELKEPVEVPFLNGEKLKSGYEQWPPPAKAADAHMKKYADAGINTLYLMVGGEWWDRKDDPEKLQEYGERVRATLEAARNHDIKILLGGFLPERKSWRNEQYETALVDGAGKTYEITAPLDPGIMEDNLTRPAKWIAEFAKDYPDTMVGFLWDFELYGHRELLVTENYSFDNLSWSTFLEERRGKLRRKGLLKEAQQTDTKFRFQWLEAHGLLPDYYKVQEEAIYELVLDAKEQIDEVHPGLFWSFYTAGIPQSWYYRGIFRALGDEEDRVLLVTYEARGLQQTSYWQEMGVNLIHGPGTLMNIPDADEWVPALTMWMEHESGYWLFPVGAMQGGDPAWKFSRHDWGSRIPPKVMNEKIEEANAQF
jgi:hypothetical protein